MKAVTTIRSKSSGFIKSKAKKETKSTKSKSDTSQIVHPKIRMQMIEEAAYFKAMNRDFQGDSCLEDWLEAETEIEASLDNNYQDNYAVESSLEEKTEDSVYCG